jgi:hypothetical protein
MSPVQCLVSVFHVACHEACRIHLPFERKIPATECPVQVLGRLRASYTRECKASAAISDWEWREKGKMKGLVRHPEMNSSCTLFWCLSIAKYYQWNKKKSPNAHWSSFHSHTGGSRRRHTNCIQNNERSNSIFPERQLINITIYNSYNNQKSQIFVHPAAISSQFSNCHIHHKA